MVKSQVARKKKVDLIPQFMLNAPGVVEEVEQEVTFKTWVLKKMVFIIQPLCSAADFLFSPIIIF